MNFRRFAGKIVCNFAHKTKCHTKGTFSYVFQYDRLFRGVQKLSRNSCTSLSRAAAGIKVRRLVEGEKAFDGTRDACAGAPAVRRRVPTGRGIVATTRQLGGRRSRAPYSEVHEFLLSFWTRRKSRSNWNTYENVPFV